MMYARAPRSSFLPQDRVASFAKMDASELLRETQRAADLTLLEQQADLAEQAKQMLNTDKDLEKHRTDLVSKERALAGMERDVKRHKEKRALEKEVGNPHPVCADNQAQMFAGHHIGSFASFHPLHKAQGTV